MKDYNERAVANLKREIASLRPILGGDVPCVNTDLCGYLVDILGTRYPGEFDIKYYVYALQSALSTGASGAEYLFSELGNINDNSNAIRTNVGTLLSLLGSDHVDSQDVFALLNLINSNAHSAYTNTNTILTNLSNLDIAVGYTFHSPTTLYSDIQTIKSSLTSFAASIVTLLANIAAVQTMLSTVALGIVASWPKSGAGDLIQAIGDWLLGQATGPGASHLTIGSLTTITTGALVSKPTGAYGLQLNLNVPSTWGKIETAPNVYLPAVGRLNQFSTWGTAGTPTPIETEFPTFYPLQPSCQQVSIQLGVGVTGQRAWLLLT